MLDGVDEILEKKKKGNLNNKRQYMKGYADVAEKIDGIRNL